MTGPRNAGSGRRPPSQNGALSQPPPGSSARGVGKGQHAQHKKQGASFRPGADSGRSSGSRSNFGSGSKPFSGQGSRLPSRSSGYSNHDHGFEPSSKHAGRGPYDHGLMSSEYSGHSSESSSQYPDHSSDFNFGHRSSSGYTSQSSRSSSGYGSSSSSSHRSASPISHGPRSGSGYAARSNAPTGSQSPPGEYGPPGADQGFSGYPGGRNDQDDDMSVRNISSLRPYGVLSSY